MDTSGVNTERMRLDSSGNLGLGVTPSAFVSFTALEMNNATLAGQSSTTLLRNAYFNGVNWIYKNTSIYGASQFQLSGNGTQTWNQAPSGTAGNAITFTQAMTLDASGNLGIGTTSPDSKLVVQGTSGTYAQIKDGTVNLFFQARSADSVGVVGTLTNHALAFWTNSAERARITPTGGFQAGGSISVGNTAPTTSGAGITFPATQSASTDANTLDDYEEGSWTPVLTAVTVGDLTVAYTTQLGFYTKIGRLVTISFNIQTSTFTRTTAAGNATITGLPFTSSSTAGSFPIGTLAVQGISKANYTQIGCLPGVNATSMTLPASGPTSNQNLDSVAITDMPSAGIVILRGSVSYIV
jgi:hypothetical protein